MKKGQTTIFVVAGLVLVLGLILYLSSQAHIYISTAPKQVAETQSVNNFINSCLTERSKLGLFYLGFIGGDVYPPISPKFFRFDEKYNIPYFYYEGQSLTLDREGFEGVLAHYVSSTLDDCIQGFDNFIADSIKWDIPTTNVDITETKVNFKLNFPVEVELQGRKETIGPEFTFSHDSRLSEMIDISQTIVNLLVNNDELIEWPYLKEVTEKGYGITAYTEKDKTMVYRIVDTQYLLDDEPYIFQFAVRVR